MKLALLGRYVGWSLKTLSLFNVITPKEFALFPEGVQQRLTTCEELLQANANLNYYAPRTWDSQDVAQFSTLVEQLNELVIESVKSHQNFESCPLGKVIIYLLGSKAYGSFRYNFETVLNNVSLASTSIKHSFLIVKSHYAFLRVSFCGSVGYQMRKWSVWEHKVLFHREAVTRLLYPVFYRTKDTEMISNEDYLYITNYLERATGCIEEVFDEIQLQANELNQGSDSEDNEEYDDKMMILSQFIQDDWKTVGDVFEFPNSQMHRLKSHSQIQTIAELISRFDAVLQLKTLELTPYLTGAVIANYAELPQIKHAGTAQRSGVRQLEKMVGLNLDFSLECLEDIPKLVEEFSDCRSLFDDGSTQTLLKETEQLLNQIIPVIFSGAKCLVRDLDFDCPEEKLHPAAAKHAKNLSQIMTKALEAINATLETALEKFTAVDFDRFVTRLFGRIPLNMFVGAANTFIDAAKAKIELNIGDKVNFSSRLARLAPLVIISPPAFNAEDLLPV